MTAGSPSSASATCWFVIARASSTVFPLIISVSIELEAIDCQLEGLGLVDDFELTLHSWLEATEAGLTGEARLDVRVSQPPLLRLIPARVLEATGRSLLAGILLGIKGRVGQQLLADYESWLLEG